jgi:two-component system OmpR family sensor kinase
VSTLLLSPRRWTLRARLIAAVVALLAVVCLVVGGVVTLSLRGFLYERLDKQVSDVTSRANFRYDGNDGPQHPRSDDGPRADQLGFLRAPGLPPGTVGAHIKGGAVDSAGRLEPGPQNQDPVPLSTAQDAAFLGLPTDGTVVTHTIPGLGEYRLAAQTAPDGDVIVAGLSVQSVNDTVTRLVLVELIVAGSGLVVAGVVGSVLVRRNLEPLQRVATTATRVSSLPLDRGDVVLAERVPDADADPRTEVGQVTLAINRMLGHVSGALVARQASETRVRQFVADASHELRTPLASIRGYAELTRRTGQPLPDDIRYAMSRIESEGARMTRLVEDLLLLARLDSGRPVERAPVDITRLVLDAVSDAAVAGPRHKWRLDLADEPVIVIGDDQRLHQVIANLLANARTHTPGGTTVLLSLERESDGVALRVSDDGPGIPTELQPEVFEGFARGDGSRARATGSTGLGLAIVEAVAHAHGGWVSVESRPGRTVFCVWLPMSDGEPDIELGVAEPSGAVLAGTAAEHRPAVERPGDTPAKPQVAHSLDSLTI